MNGIQNHGLNVMLNSRCVVVKTQMVVYRSLSGHHEMSFRCTLDNRRQLSTVNDR